MVVPPAIPLGELDLIIGSDIVFGGYWSEAQLGLALHELLHDQRAQDGLQADSEIGHNFYR